MLIRPHDAAINDEEWRTLVADHPFGTLIASGTNRDLPVVVPTHFHFDGRDTIRLHLAKPNPVWAVLLENPRCLFVVVAAVTYVPTSWEAPPDTTPEWGSRPRTTPPPSSTAPQPSPTTRARSATTSLTSSPPCNPTNPTATHSTRPAPTRPNSARFADSNSPSTTPEPSSSSTEPNPTPCANKSPTATDNATSPATTKPSPTSYDDTHPSKPRRDLPASTATSI